MRRGAGAALGAFPIEIGKYDAGQAAQRQSQNTRLVSVTATTNWWDSELGTLVSTCSSSGAPMKCGSTISISPAIEAGTELRKITSPRPAAVAAAASTHQIWRESSGAVGTPGNSGGRPIPGAIVKTRNPASPHIRPSCHDTFSPVAPLRTEKKPASNIAKPMAVSTFAGFFSVRSGATGENVSWHEGLMWGLAGFLVPSRLPGHLQLPGVADGAALAPVIICARLRPRASGS